MCSAKLLGQKDNGAGPAKKECAVLKIWARKTTELGLQGRSVCTKMLGQKDSGAGPAREECAVLKCWANIRRVRKV